MSFTQVRPVVRTIDYLPGDGDNHAPYPVALSASHVLSPIIQQQLAAGSKSPLGVLHADEIPPNGTFHGEDEIPPGTFHGMG